MTDDDEPRTTQRRLHTLSLEPLGIAELQAYIGELRDEILRADAEISRKANHRSTADAVFRRP